MTPEIAALEEAIKRYDVHGWVDDEPGENNDMIEEMAQAARAHLRLLKAMDAGDVKILPVTITHDMFVAFAETWFSKKRCIDDCEMEDCYASMLAAAEPFDFGD